MATNTPNLNLIKPTISENIDLAVLNQNMDTIDATLGAPSTEVADLLAVYDAFNAPWVESTPTIYGVTGTAVTNILALFRQGKTVTGRFRYFCSSWTNSGTVGMELEVPDDCYSLIGATPQAVGTFTALNNARTITGVVVMYATSGANSRLRFLANITKNVTTGPWTVPVAISSDAFWVNTASLNIIAEFFYEAP